MIVLRTPRQLHYFEGSTQVHIQTIFFGLPIERRRAMEDGIGSVNEPVVAVGIKAELRQGYIAAKNSDLRLQVFVKFRKREVQLQRVPKTQLSITRIPATNQQIQRRIVLLEQISGDMRADVSGSTGQEYRHVAPFVPVFITSPLSVVAAEVVVTAAVRCGICSRGSARASSGRPSISG